MVVCYNNMVLCCIFNYIAHRRAAIAMLEKIYINELNHTDLNMYRCGIEDCKSGHSWGPALRDHYIIHYVLGGRGIFRVNGITYHLEENDGFLIMPNTIVYYEADEGHPWSYGWVGFHGMKVENYLSSAGLSAKNPIFRYNRDRTLHDCLIRMIQTKGFSTGRETMLLGLLYQFLSYLIEASCNIPHIKENISRKESYIKKAINFVAMNYSRKISIAETAAYVGLDRSYLYSIFREMLNMSPSEYLINYRIEKACFLIANPDLSIGEISRSVGYEDSLLFSKVFKNIKGVSPRAYRKQQ